MIVVDGWRDTAVARFLPSHSLRSLFRQNTLLSLWISPPKSKEQFSLQCGEIKNKAITLANRNRERQANKPIRTRSKFMQPTPSAGKHIRESLLTLMQTDTILRVTHIDMVDHRSQHIAFHRGPRGRLGNNIHSTYSPS